MVKAEPFLLPVKVQPAGQLAVMVSKIFALKNPTVLHESSVHQIMDERILFHKLFSLAFKIRRNDIDDNQNICMTEKECNVITVATKIDRIIAKLLSNLSMPPSHAYECLSQSDREFRCPCERLRCYRETVQAYLVVTAKWI
ncbi:hypothetical protein [Nitrosomonas sp. Nm58]|uniref:hypothetical protein n=1 Tax=Nitrosomonas sp. Nm58 TaxID=200126 RepID=UPI0008977CB7|nr:hypothetical protein [Nitrosomonas sp. Nm58]SDZ06618.1 hypothetical protein SAMN05421754_10512 [Nitrosomonas sp. Nm58]